MLNTSPVLLKHLHTLFRFRRKYFRNFLHRHSGFTSPYNPGRFNLVISIVGLSTQRRVCTQLEVQGTRDLFKIL